MTCIESFQGENITLLQYLIVELLRGDGNHLARRSALDKDPALNCSLEDEFCDACPGHDYQWSLSLVGTVDVYCRWCGVYLA